MKTVLRLTYSIACVIVLTTLAPSRALAQDHDSHGQTAQPRTQSAGEKKRSNGLVRIVRESTTRFRDAAVAQGEGYGLLFGCVSGGDYGAMGLHFVNFPLVTDGEIDATKPEIVLYEQMPNGSLRMTGVDYLVLAADWDQTHTSAPELNGQLFHYFDAPNRYGLPPFYTLHVWAWKPNPTGAFVNWHSDVSCEQFAGGQQ